MPKNLKENRAHNFNSAVADSMNSEYMHLIYFEHRPNPMPGYSGKAGYREKQNSIDNFINYVLRLMKNSYYPGSTRDIEEMRFFQREGQEMIVRMLPGAPLWEPKYITDEKWKKARKVVDEIFDLLEKKWPLIKIQDFLMVKRKEKESFNATDMTPHFTSDKALVRYCEILLKKGYAAGEVENYLRNYRTKYF
jgi:hypothetical protein